MMLQHHRFWVAFSLALSLGISLSACQQPPIQDSQLPPPQESNADANVPPAVQSAATSAPSPVVSPASATLSSTPSTTTSVNPDFAQEIENNTQCSFVVADSGSVNIRKGPGTQYGVVAQLKRGDGVRAQYRQGDWVKLAAKTNGFPPNETFEPLDGWISNQYLNGCSEDQFDRWRN